MEKCIAYLKVHKNTDVWGEITFSQQLFIIYMHKTRIACYAAEKTKYAGCIPLTFLPVCATHKFCSGYSPA